MQFERNKMRHKHDYDLRYEWYNNECYVNGKKTEGKCDNDMNDIMNVTWS